MTSTTTKITIEELVRNGKAVLLEPASKIATDPSRMIPLQYGESLHIGYVPLSEEEAFEIAHRDHSQKKWIAPSGDIDRCSIVVARDETNCDRLVQLCHKFISLNLGITQIVPKIEFLNGMPQKSIFECHILYNSTNGKQVKIRIHIRAAILLDSKDYELQENQEDVPITEAFVISVHRLNGDVTTHGELFDHLKSYILSDGHMDPRIRRTSSYSIREDEL